MMCRGRCTLWPYYIHVNVKLDILWPRISNKRQDNPQSLEMSDVGAEGTAPVYLLPGEKWCFHITFKQRQRCKWVADTTLKSQKYTAGVTPLIRWNEKRHNSEPVPVISQPHNLLSQNPRECYHATYISVLKKTFLHSVWPQNFWEYFVSSYSLAQPILTSH
jgi:hypothetical protein